MGLQTFACSRAFCSSAFFPRLSFLNSAFVDGLSSSFFNEWRKAFVGLRSAFVDMLRLAFFDGMRSVFFLDEERRAFAVTSPTIVFTAFTPKKLGSIKALE